MTNRTADGAAPVRASAGGPLPSGRRRGALTVGARLRGAARDTGPRDLRRGASVETDGRTPRDGRARRLGPHELLGPPARAPGGSAWRNRDPLRTSRLWRWWHWLGFGYWAGLTGVATWRAWRQRDRPRAESRS